MIEKYIDLSQIVLYPENQALYEFAVIDFFVQFDPTIDKTCVLMSLLGHFQNVLFSIWPPTKLDSKGTPWDNI